VIQCTHAAQKTWVTPNQDLQPTARTQRLRRLLFGKGIGSTCEQPLKKYVTDRRFLLVSLHLGVCVFAGVLFRLVFALALLTRILHVFVL
jgi:hypothetical protein